jgi:hypothetical protein
MDPRKQAIRGLLDEFLTAIKQPDKTSIVPAPNRWFAKPEDFPHQQPMIERALAANNMTRSDFPHGAYLDPRTGQDLTGRMMQDVGAVIDPNTGRPVMSGRESGLENFADLEKKLGNQTLSNLVRRSKFKPLGGDPLLNDIPFITTVESGPHFYGLGMEYASPTQLFQVQTGDNPHLRPKSRGDVFGMGEVVGRMQIGKGPEHDVYEKLFVAPRGSDVPGKKLSKAEGGEVHAAGGGLKQAVRGKIDEFLSELNKPAKAAVKAAPQDEALRLAQLRAALPPAQGGLGLPANNTPMQRAKAMSWNTPGFHATNADIKKFDPNLYGASDYGSIGQGVYIDPSKSAGYANLVASIVGKDRPANVMPLLVREGNVFNADQLPLITNAKTSKEVSKNLKKLGYDSVMSEVNGQPNEMVVFDPDRVRSRFAAFDPFRRDAATAAAFGVAAPDLLAQEQEKAAGGEVHMDKGGDPMLADLIERYNTPRNKSRYSAGIFDSNDPGEVTSITPTVKERMASGLQSAMESAGSDRSKARQRAQTILGGPNSRLPGGFGVADIGAMVNPVVAAGMIPLYGEAALHDLASVPDALKRGDYVGAGVDTAFGLADLIPAVGQGKRVAKGVAKGIKNAVTSDAGYNLAQNVLNATGTAPMQIMMGPKAKTFRHDAAALAEQMEKEGKTPDEIWQATKTMRAPDNQFRQELSDLNMKYSASPVRSRQYETDRKRYSQAIDKATTQDELQAAQKYYEKQRGSNSLNFIGKAQEFVDHPELFQAYPELANYAFRELEPTHKKFTAPENVYGFYSPGQKTVTVSTDAPFKRSTALHELQHAIQEIEGWQSGSSPEYMATKLAERDVFKDAVQKQQELLDSLSPTSILRPSVEKSLQEAKENFKPYELLEGLDPYDAYRRVSGEEEARMVQARRDYPEEKLAERPPFMDYEADPSLHITDFATGGAVMMAGGKDVTKEAIKQGVKKGIDAVEEFLKSLRESKSPAVKMAPQDEALRLAQFRATLPPEQGGFSLPANNTPEQRAIAGNWNRDTYHGALRNIKRLDPRKGSTESHAGQGVYSTDSPRDASQNYASVYGPDVEGKINRSMDEQEKDWRRIHRRLRDEALTPRQQEILLSNTIGADNLGVVYPLKIRSDKSIHLDRPEENPAMVGPFVQYDEAADRWIETPQYPTFDQALDEYSGRGGETNPIRDFAYDYGEEIPARDLFNAIKEQGAKDYLYDPDTGELISGGVAAADFLKHFGIDEIRHTPQFNNRDLNIAHEHIISLNPDNVRSRFAAFDPWRRDAATAAAFGVAAPDLLAKEQEKPEDRLTIEEFLKTKGY